MEYIIRDARPEDMPRVLDLIRELAHFEKEEGAVELTSEKLANDGFGDQKLFHCFVAEVDNEIEGMALVLPQVLHLEGSCYPFGGFDYHRTSSWKWSGNCFIRFGYKIRSRIRR